MKTTRTFGLRMIGRAALTGAVTIVAICGGANADNFDGGGDLATGDGTGTKWEDAANWELDLVPGDNGIIVDAAGNIQLNDEGTEFESLNTNINAFNVLYDTDTWDFLQANNQAVDNPLNPGVTVNTLVQSATQHRVQRLIVNENLGAGPFGVCTLTFDFGDPAGLQTRTILQTNATSAIIGGRNNSETTVNMISGEVNTASRTQVGGRTGAVATINVMGGTFIVGRSNLQLGINNALDTQGGTGIVNVTAGTLRTRVGAAIGGASTFNVVGSTPTEIGIGSEGNIDGFWFQQTGGVLSVGLDAGGLTPILIDDFDDDGAGAEGNATFEAGSILDPFDAGGANNAWTTVMIWEGTLTGLPDLSAAAVSAGWEMRVEGNELQVRNLSFPDPVTTPAGDFNGDGVVDCDDLDGYVGNIGNIGAAATGPLAQLDIDGDGTLSAGDAGTHIATLVVTTNGVTGTALGDANCDGSVSVLGDAFILIDNLGDDVTSFSLGDFNFDGTVSVLGDAFILIDNLGFSN